MSGEIPTPLEIVVSDLKTDLADRDKELQKPVDKELEVFAAYYPEGLIRSVSFEDIPEVAQDLLTRRSRMYIDKGEEPTPFDRIYEIKQLTGVVTYAATHKKTYKTNKETEELTYFANTQDMRLIGCAEIRWNEDNDSEYFKNKPFIGWIKSEEGFYRQGIGTENVLMMNAYAQMLYGQPLYSDTVNSEMMVALWEKLVSEGKATKFKEGPHDRYVFNENESDGDSSSISEETQQSPQEKRREKINRQKAELARRKEAQELDGTDFGPEGIYYLQLEGKPLTKSELGNKAAVLTQRQLEQLGGVEIVLPNGETTFIDSEDTGYEDDELLIIFPEELGDIE